MAALHPDRAQGAQQPIDQGSPLEDDVGPQQHVGLKCNRLAVRIDLLTLQACDDAIRRFVQLDRTASVARHENGLRDSYDLPAICPEMLVGKSVEEETHRLSGFYEADGARRYE